MPRIQVSGLKRFIDYLDERNLRGLAVLQVLFALYESDDPKTVKQLYSIGSGYRRRQLSYLEHHDLIKRQLSVRQRQSKATGQKPHAYALAFKGRNVIKRLMEEEGVTVAEKGHLSRWLQLAQANGIHSFALLKLLVQIEEAPGRCGRELFSYRSGANNDQIFHCVQEGLAQEILSGSRKEKFPGKRWLALREYLREGTTAGRLRSTASD